MTSEEKLTVHATPCIKQFRDDVETLKELPGNDFVREL